MHLSIEESLTSLPFVDVRAPLSPSVAECANSHLQRGVVLFCLVLSCFVKFCYAFCVFCFVFVFGDIVVIYYRYNFADDFGRVPGLTLFPKATGL